MEKDIRKVFGILIISTICVVYGTYLASAHTSTIYLKLTGATEHAMRVYTTLIEKYKPTAKLPSSIKILFWSRYHNQKHWWPHMTQNGLNKTCGPISCEFTYDKDQLGTSDALLFDTFRSTDLIPPTNHTEGQYWILYNHEWLDTGSSNDLLHGGVFNLTATYREHADISVRYGQCVPRQSDYTLPVNISANKTAGILWLVSDCKTKSLRENYVKELRKYIKVDSFGTCGSKGLGEISRLFVGRNMSSSDVDLMNNYKFYLSFENTFCKGYMTEKIFKVMTDDIFTVPIVYGSGPYKGILPDRSYINTADFSSPRNLAEYLKQLDGNRTLYESYFDYKRRYECSSHAQSKDQWPCDVCYGVAKAKMNKVVKTVAYSEIQEMFLPRGNCNYTMGKAKPKIVPRHQLPKRTVLPKRIGVGLPRKIAPPKRAG